MGFGGIWKFGLSESYIHDSFLTFFTGLDTVYALWTIPLKQNKRKPETQLWVDWLTQWKLLKASTSFLASVQKQSNACMWLMTVSLVLQTPRQGHCYGSSSPAVRRHPPLGTMLCEPLWLSLCAVRMYSRNPVLFLSIPLVQDDIVKYQGFFFLIKICTFFFIRKLGKYRYSYNLLILLYSVLSIRKPC